MKRYIDPDKSLWEELTQRVVTDDSVIEDRVNSIISRVRKEGDKALMELASEIDKVDLSAGVEVTPDEVASAVSETSEELKAAIMRLRSSIQLNWILLQG